MLEVGDCDGSAGPGGAALTIDHPFTILSSRGRDSRSYHVRFGLNSPGVASSPFYQEMWLTIPALKALKCVSAGRVDHIVKRFHAGKRGPMQAEDNGSGVDDPEQDEETRQSRMTSEDSGGEQTDSDDSDTHRKARPSASRVRPTGARR